MERVLEEGEGGRERLLACQEVRSQVDKIQGLQKDKGMAGIHDLINWTLAQVLILLFPLVSAFCLG